MAEIPPIPDNANSWLPPKSSPKEVSSRYEAQQLSCMDKYSQRQNGFRAPPPPKLAPKTKGFIPAAGYCSINRIRPPLPMRFPAMNGGRYDAALPGFGHHGAAPCFFGPDANQYLRPPQPQVNGFVENGDKMMHWQQNYLLPLQAKVRCGTGVFHPNYPGVKHNRSVNRRGTKNNKRQVEVTPQSSKNRSKANKVRGLEKKQECHHHQPFEMGLPNEWAY